jgi:uncharacterized protein YfaS (alpha-2-macroglobulin family)
MTAAYREPVPFAVMEARIRARQDAGRAHREVMRRRRIARQVAWARERAATARYVDAARDDAALISRAAALAEARATARGELAGLVADQERDERYGTRIPRRPWLLSLQAPTRYGTPLGELIPA